MVRVLSGVSFCFMLVVAAGACSSESTEGGQAGSGSNEAAGTGTGGNGTGGSGGSGTTTAGASSGGGAGSGGRAEGGRAGGSTVGGNGSCTPGVVTCVDADTAATCDDTGKLTQVKCTDLAEFGINSTECVGDATEGSCDGEAADVECLDGSLLVAACSGYTPDQFQDLYVACFQNTNDIKPVVHCLAPFLPATEDEPLDCEAAHAACIAGEAGAGGAGG